MYQKLYNSWVEHIKSNFYHGSSNGWEQDFGSDKHVNMFYSDIEQTIKIEFPNEYKILNSNKVKLLYRTIDEYFADYVLMYPGEINTNFFKDRWNILKSGMENKKIVLGKELRKLSKFKDPVSWTAHIDLNSGKFVKENIAVEHKLRQIIREEIKKLNAQ